MMDREKIQYIFIYSAILLIIAIILIFVGYFVYNAVKWAGYKKDENKKVFVERIEKALSIDKKDRTIDDYIELGNNYYNLREYNLAIKAYNNAIKLGISTVAYNNLANAYKEQKRYKKAEEILLASLEIDPQQPEIYIKLYELYKIPWEKKGFTSESILKQGLEKNPNNYNILVNLADYYEEISNITEAINYYKKALEINPKNSILKEKLEELQTKK